MQNDQDDAAADIDPLASMKSPSDFAGQQLFIRAKTGTTTRCWVGLTSLGISTPPATGCCGRPGWGVGRAQGVLDSVVYPLGKLLTPGKSATGGAEERRSSPMQQTELGLNLSTKRTRKREFLAQMERVVPWTELEALIAPYAPQACGRPPFLVSTMLRIHFMQQWFTLSDPGDGRSAARRRCFVSSRPELRDAAADESTILRFRHLLEENKLAAQILQTVNELLQAKGCC